MGRPPTGEKENMEQTKHRLRQSRLNGLSDLDAELIFHGAIRPTRNLMASLESSFKCERNKRSQRLRCGFRDRPQLTQITWTYLLAVKRISTGASKYQARLRRPLALPGHSKLVTCVITITISIPTRRGSHNGRRKLGWPAEHDRRTPRPRTLDNMHSAVKTTPN
jgi:hypothetical protein